MFEIPFVKNPGGQCMQSNMMMALRYFFPDKKFYFKQINKKMRRKRKKWTFPSQAAVVLKDFGLRAKAYSSKDISTEPKKIIAGFKKAFGKDYDIIIKNIDLNTSEYFRKRAKEERVFEVRKNSLKDLEKYFKKSYFVVPCVDWNTLHRKKGPFLCHFVTIVNIDKDNIWIHDPNEGPNIKYSKKLFNKAYTAPAINDDILVIYGRIKKMATAKKKKVVIGGTFDVFHEGHEAFLRKAFSLGVLTIGLTSDILAQKTKKRRVMGFKYRKKELEDFIKKEFKAKAKIVKKIEDKFGPTLKEDFDYIVVSPLTYPTAELINWKRRKINKKPIKIVKIQFVLAKDGKPISSTRILKGEIDRQGKLLK